MEKTISGWKDELGRAHQRMADLFARSEVRDRSLAYLEGLLSGCERKNSWQVAEWAGEASPYGMQYLLDRSRWEASAVQARLSDYVKVAWKRLSAGQGAKGERLYGWALVRWAEQQGWQHTLLVRRSLDAATGIRYSEMAGLQWRDVDWENSCIHIERRWIRGNVDTPKTNASKLQSQCPRCSPLICGRGARRRCTARIGEIAQPWPEVLS
jgi:hypothetical protein